jgi:hypothetical protein
VPILQIGHHLNIQGCLHCRPHKWAMTTGLSCRVSHFVGTRWFSSTKQSGRSESVTYVLLFAFGGVAWQIICHGQTTVCMYAAYMYRSHASCPHPVPPGHHGIEVHSGAQSVGDA